jgi:hypothetical protein
MGLDCVIKYFNGKEYTDDIPKEIADKFDDIEKYFIIGYSKGKHYNNDYYGILFRGKAYSDLIKYLTKYSLYQDLSPEMSKEIYMKLNTLLEDFEHTWENTEEIQKAYDNIYNLQDWTQHFSEIKIPSPKELTGLKEIFKICYENNLQIYAGY